MTFIAECPNCGKRLPVKDEFAGRSAKCGACGTSFVLEPAAEAEPDLQLMTESEPEPVGAGVAAAPAAASAGSQSRPRPASRRRTGGGSGSRGPGAGTGSRANRQRARAPEDDSLYAPPEDWGDDDDELADTSDDVTRARRTLKQFPRARGKRDEFPLDINQLKQLAQTERERKKIRTAVTWFRLQFAIQVVLTGVFMLMFLMMPRGLRAAGMGQAMIGIAIIAGFSVLSFFSARYTYRCRKWPLITWVILYSIGAVLQLFSYFNAPFKPRGAEIELAIALAVIGLLIFVVARAIPAVDKFLRRPMWTQEALVNAKL